MGNLPDREAVKKEQFAWEFGYATFEEMHSRSQMVFSRYGENWLITPVEKGFLAWVDRFYDRPLGYFNTFAEAEEFIDQFVRSLSVLTLHIYGF